MPLRCPDCGAAALRVEETLEMGSDDRSDEVTLQIVLCADCGRESVAVYEDSRRGAFGEEFSHHATFPTDEDALDEIRGIIASCRDPEDPDCVCRGHQRAREILRDRIDPAGLDWSRPKPIGFVRE
jgi:hypothetical protein